MCCWIASFNIVVDLSLEVTQKRTRSNAEKIGSGPFISQLFLHQNQPCTCILCCADAPSWLETHLEKKKTEVSR